MTKELWVNLAAKDLERSKSFYRDAGFQLKDGPGNTDVSFVLSIGEKAIIVMIFEEKVFQQIARETSLRADGTTALLSFDADSKEEVDTWASNAEKAGGEVFGKPAAFQGWMYGCGFSDPDGNKWNVLYMDPEGAK